MRAHLFKFSAWQAVLLLLGCGPLLAVAAKLPPGYSLETIESPAEVRLEIGGLALTPGGDLLLCTRIGEVWLYRPGSGGGQWSLFADGLHSPLGIAVDEATGAIYVGQRTELTQLVDTNGDGVADVYRRIGGGWGYSGNYHEFAFGPVRDATGNFYMTLNLAHAPGVQDSIMGRIAAYRGWAMQITPDGSLKPFASGMRSPAGLGANREGELFFTENEGDWIPTSALFHLVEGRFYGHPSSLADHPDFQGVDLNSVPTETFARRLAPPAVWFPHRELADSPGEITFNETGGKFGPFEGHIFMGDHNRSNVTRIVLEKIDGEYQGVAFEFMSGLASGCIRSVFGADGSLWLGQMDHGWGNIGGEPFALQRLVWDGTTIPFEIESIRLLPDGFRLTFTKPVLKATAADPEHFAVKSWHYHYHVTYGSDRLDEKTVAVQAVTVSADQRVVDLKLARMEPGKVYEISAARVTGNNEEKLTNTRGWYTLNRLVADDRR